MIQVVKGGEVAVLIDRDLRACSRAYRTRGGSEYRDVVVKVAGIEALIADIVVVGRRGDDRHPSRIQCEGRETLEQLKSVVKIAVGVQNADAGEFKLTGTQIF